MAEKKNVAEKKKAIRSTARLTTLDDFLGEEGKRDEFEAIAVKEVLAWQIGQTMKEKNISRSPTHEDFAQPDWPPARPKGRQCHANHASACRAHGREVAPARTDLKGGAEPNRKSDGQYLRPPLNPRRNHEFVPLICPTCQMSSASLEVSFRNRHGTLHGVVFDILVGSTTRAGLSRWRSSDGLPSRADGTGPPSPGGGRWRKSVFAFAFAQATPDTLRRSVSAWPCHA
jgi:hypothetical protein